MSKPKTKGAQLRDVNFLFGDSNLDDHGNIRVGEVVELPIASLIDFHNHPFIVHEDEALEDLMESIRVRGVLTAILVRPSKDFEETGNYEKLAGHRRTMASRLLGNVTVPARILHDLSDEEALAIVVETNLMQRSFGDLLPSEKALVIGIAHANMFSTTKRSRILSALGYEQDEEVLDEVSRIGTGVGGVGNNDSDMVNKDKSNPNKTTNEKIAEKYGLSVGNVKRWVRIAEHLIPSLKEAMDRDELGITTAHTVSNLSQNEQELLAYHLINHPYPVDMKKADQMLLYSNDGKLNETSMMLILTGKATPKKETEPTIRINSDTFKRYFTKEQSKQEIETILEEALELYYMTKNENISV